MRIVLFCHSLLSDWNHGNAHFLRGLVTELAEAGHRVDVFEPKDAWSVENLVAERGEGALEAARAAYPAIHPHRYELAKLDLDAALDSAELVIAHEWNPPELIAALGEKRRKGRFRLLFHDTHHRIVTAPHEMARFDLRHYDGVLAFGEGIRRLYLEKGWARRAWIFHEAADARVFRPHPEIAPSWDVVWIGNWGDEERTHELHEFLLGPVKRLGLRAKVYGVRYPEHARAALAEAGIEYGGWLPNFEVPLAFAQAKVTVHVPRRPYVEALPGIPTIRPFEAMACGIPLVSSPWEDREHLFHPGRDFLFVRDGAEMERVLKQLMIDDGWRRALGQHGRSTILARHTCAHRALQLLEIAAELGLNRRATPRPMQLEGVIP